jgi:BolA family transcriptional regulator, general stress-responsive regulator
MEKMTRTEQIETRLREALSPHELIVRDDSESHRGHSGYQEGGESHFHVVLRSAAFAGQSRIARHRMVHSALGPELVAAIHALSMDLGE